MCDPVADVANDDGFIRCVARCPEDGALSMGRIDPILSPPFQDRMHGDEAALVEDADLIRELMC